METKIAQQIRKNLRSRGYSKIAIAHTRKGGSDYYRVTAEDPLTNHSISFGFHTVKEDWKGNDNGKRKR